MPEPVEIQVALGVGVQPDRPSASQLLDGLEESLDAAILPGREGRGALMLDTDQAETEPEECEGEDGLIVGTDAPRPAEALDRVQDDAKDRNRGLVAHVSQSQTGSGAVVEKPKNGAFAAAIAEVGEIESPYDVRRHGLRPPALDLAADSGDLVLTLPEHRGDEGLADTSPQLVRDTTKAAEVVERDVARPEVGLISELPEN